MANESAVPPGRALVTPGRKLLSTPKRSGAAPNCPILARRSADGPQVTTTRGETVGAAIYARLMALSVHEREQFLAEPHIAALAVSAGESRGPLTVPIWYQYAPGGEAWVLTSVGSRKAQLIEAAGRFSLMVERLEPTIRYVSVEGPVTRTIPGTDELLWEITRRYLSPEKVPSYIEFAKAELGEQVAIYLRPQRWLSADLGPS